ncbi:MAG: phenylacetate--CoA ligase family protein [Candidatus Wildermuthbacteria bacterium]|nr:phenylacetate--CoA ligase family protein [Candidatus Wildermuthbacteria bacterium]
MSNVNKLYMVQKTNTLIEKARNALYYRKLWGSAAMFKDFPLASKDLFDSRKIKESLAVNEDQVAYYYFSAGTTSNPKMIPFTEHEWVGRGKYRKECYEIATINKRDKVAILLPFGPWVAGPSAQTALFMLGCTVFPMGLLSNIDEIRERFSIFQKHNIGVVITTPSFAQRLLYVNEMLGRETRIKKIITSGEYISDTLREKLHDSFGATVYSSYASSESFIGIECSIHNGFHFDPKQLIVETIDQHTYLPTRGVGLLVITSLVSEAIPLIRYPLGDLGLIDYAQCPCGRSWPRIIWEGRVQETFKVSGGVKVHSYQIREALSKSHIPICRCKIEVSDNEMGESFVVFNLYTATEIGTQKHVLLEELSSLLTNMSIDFSDVVYHKIVRMSIGLMYEENAKKNMKIKIEVLDKQKYAR